MTPNEYQSAAMSKEADQERIRQRIFSEGLMATRLENAVRGISDESGELSGAIKRWLEYGQALDRANVIEECGDILWRVSQALLAIGATLEEAMEANLRKLNVRYAGRLTEHEAAEHNRDRSAESTALSLKVHNLYSQPRRTRSQVLAARRNTIAGGCCDRFADQMGCSCLEDAVDDLNLLSEPLQESSEWEQDGHGFGHQKLGGA